MILSVINTKESPASFYKFFKSIKVPLMDCLFPDATYDNVDLDDVNNIGHWLSELFDYWYFDETFDKPIIKLFDLAINLFFGNEERGNEIFGRKLNTCFTIKPNGNIEAVDSLKICGDGFTHTTYNVLKDKFESIIDN